MDPTSITELLNDLQDPDDFTRAHATFVLGMLGEPAVEPLTKLLDHTDRDVRLRAAWALGVIGASSIPTLLELAEGQNDDLRVEAIRILGVIGEGRVISHLIHALTDTEPRIAQRAAEALGKIGDPRAFHPLLTALHHPSADVRYAACHALTYLRIQDAIPLLEELAVEDDMQTSWGASVNETARRAVQEIASARPRVKDDEFARISALLRDRQPNE